MVNGWLKICGKSQIKLSIPYMHKPYSHWISWIYIDCIPPFFNQPLPLLCPYFGVGTDMSSLAANSKYDWISSGLADWPKKTVYLLFLYIAYYPLIYITYAIFLGARGGNPPSSSAAWLPNKRSRSHQNTGCLSRPLQSRGCLSRRCYPVGLVDLYGKSPTGPHMAK